MEHRFDDTRVFFAGLELRPDTIVALTNAGAASNRIYSAIHQQYRELTAPAPSLPPLENTISCFVKLFFALAFILVHLASRKPGRRPRRRRGSSLGAFNRFLCALASLVSVAHLGLLLWIAVQASWALPAYLWFFFLANTVSWALLAASTVISKQRAARTTAFVWWIALFVATSLVTAFSVWFHAEFSAYSILTVATWPVACFFLIGSIKGFRDNDRELNYDDEDEQDEQDLVQPFIKQQTEHGSPDSPTTPLADAGWWSKLSFAWLNPLLALGHDKTLELQDVPDLPKEERSECDHRALANSLQSQRSKKGSASVLWALVSCFGRQFVFTGFLALVRTLAISVSPLFIYLFIEVTAGRLHFLYGGYVVIAGLVVSKFAQSLSQRHWSFYARYTGARVRSAIVAEVYEKQLRLANSAKQRHGAGEVVSYIGVDAYRLGDFVWWMHYNWTAVLQLALALGILVATIGWATLACVAVLIATVCIQFPTSKVLQESQRNFMITQDKRLRATTEILNSMKIIKLQSWEEEFKTIIKQHREEELNWLGSMHGKRSLSLITFWFSYTIAIALALGTYALMGHQLSSSIIFTVFSAFGNTQEPVRLVPELLAITSQVRVSLNRLDRFLQDDEVAKDAVDRESLRGSDIVVRVQDGTFSWTRESQKKTLRNVNFEIRRGNKVAVCGAVGSGKTSLLSALLGEIPKLSGKVEVSGTIAYVSQSAWIQTGTIKDNILFGKPYDEQKYRSVLKCCALESDLKILPFGDQTEIGERGLNLSGGQKQRVQLARAVYNDADIYLLDDPFSAVDAHTAAALFHDCVMKALGEKTVVLVTHQVEFLPTVDKILVMQDGEVIQSGQYEELVQSGLAFEKLVNAHKEALDSFQQRQSERNENGQASDDPEYKRNPSIKKNPSIVRRNSSKKGDESGVTSQLTEREEKGTGDLGLQPYKDYITISKGKWLFVTDLLSQAGLVAGQAAAGLWLATQVQNPSINSKALVLGYTLISWSTSFCFIIRSTAHIKLGLKASREFFYRLMDSLFRAPMSFFDSTPTGRILSRASNDMSILDIDLNQTANIMIAFIFDLPSVFIVLIIVMWPYVFFVLPMLYMIYSVESYFRKTAQELMRLTAMTKAPIVNLSGETINGVTSIRAFNVAEQFRVRNLRYCDADASVYMHNFGVMEWLVLRVETCGTILLGIFGFMLATFKTSSGLAGIGLSYGMIVNVSLVVITQWYCQLANHIIAVERIKQYMYLPTEAPGIIEENRPPRDWPQVGQIKLENLQIRYRPNSPLVLRGITCTFEGGHKIGVVGRTGSGKTTLIGALFRLMEPAGGRILIDGIDIVTIGLRDLRSKLGIIPQEPTLFRGTVRSNLDPLGTYSDGEVWEVLDKCQMGREIRSIPGQLDSAVADEGGNWSAGQRQLFCLGRVLLRRTKILVLDEATASIDSTTDAVLQRVIREEFASCTVVTVAHRIPTVISSDRVLALHDGRLAEYDSPDNLLQNQSSLFAKLVAEYWAQSSGKQG